MRAPVSSRPEFVAAAVTPRNAREEIDFASGFELIDFLCRAGVRGIALFTAIGEYASLAADERSRFLCLAVRRSRVPLYVGIGAATLDAALDLARDARDTGADALLLPPPHGFAYTQEDLREFYLQFAAQSEPGPPVYLIDSPGLCTPVAPSTADVLIATGAFAGMADFLSEAACAVPELVAAHRAALAAGNADDARRLESALGEFNAWAREFPGPVALKTAVSLRGIEMGPLPVPLTPEKHRRLDGFRAWFTEWLPAAKNPYANA